MICFSTKKFVNFVLNVIELLKLRGLSNKSDTIRGLLNCFPNFYAYRLLRASMHGALNHEQNVRLSVRLSNAWIVIKWKKLLPNFFIPYKRYIYLVFWQEEWLVGDDPSTNNFGPNRPRRFRNADCQFISARSASAVTPCKKVQSW